MRDPPKILQNQNVPLWVPLECVFFLNIWKNLFGNSLNSGRIPSFWDTPNVMSFFEPMRLGSAPELLQSDHRFLPRKEWLSPLCIEWCSLDDWMIGWLDGWKLVESSVCFIRRMILMSAWQNLVCRLGSVWSSWTWKKQAPISWCWFSADGSGCCCWTTFPTLCRRCRRQGPRLNLLPKISIIDPQGPFSIHGTGIFTYMDVWFLW